MDRLCLCLHSSSRASAAALTQTVTCVPSIFSKSVREERNTARKHRREGGPANKIGEEEFVFFRYFRTAGKTSNADDLCASD